MRAYRMTAVVAGVVLIIATVANMVGVMIVTPFWNAPDYLTSISEHQGQVFLAAFLVFIGGLSCAGVAIALYPVLRTSNPGLALGSVAFRAIEGGLYVLIAVLYLVMASLGDQAVRAGETATPAYLVSGELLKAGREWLGPCGVLTFALGGLLYYWVLFQSRLIPRWLSAWGLIGVVSLAVSGVLVMFNVIESLSTAQVVLAAPIGLQEMVLALWLLVKGFNTAAVAAEPARRPSTLPAAA